MYTLFCPCSLAKERFRSTKIMKRGPGSLEELVKKVIKDMGKDGKLTKEEIVSIWESVVGKPAAAHSRPVSFRAGTLIVNVDGSSWLYELTLKKKEILRGLGERLKLKKLKGIRLRVGEVDG